MVIFAVCREIFCSVECLMLNQVYRLNYYCYHRALL